MDAVNRNIIWCLLDKKPGHQNQSIGLAEALSRQASLQIQTVALPSWHGCLMKSVLQLSNNHQHPKLIIAAGHRTHVPLILLSRRFACPSVVLMKPSLPLKFFDVAIIPTVHRLKSVPNHVLETTGVLNRLQPADQRDSGTCFCLIGGPSRHFQWDTSKVIHQLERVLKESSSQKIIVVTSRRTPLDFVEQFRSVSSKIDIVQPEDVDSDWLKNRLPFCETAWVTEDSVSMVYEAVTAGAKIGLLELARHKHNRVTESIDVLVRNGNAVRWSKWQTTGQLNSSTSRLQEADRAATWLLQKNWLPLPTPHTVQDAA